MGYDVKQRGFEDAVHHFIECVQGDTKPVVDGLEGLKRSSFCNLC